ncbi:MaoC family protein [Desulfocucumis palustris]|uniref:MaoC family protein n=1 Tax=Desulfocucumis palustris TaxID=1898651 RepID=A0A2L2XA70_9FIRM|nr:MaoC/PaaZ C-terminal domain-containing protein [Desulfocucumis palustris]GBF33058.1 MaoC family protein [Desulfocucumis palustris]
MKTPLFSEINIGDQMPALVKDPVSEVQLVKYAGASGDFNPIHFQNAVGKMAGFGGVIAHGMLIMGFVGQAITDWIPQRNLKKLKARFVNITKPGDVITVTGRVTAKRIEDRENIIICEVKAEDQNSQVKVEGSFEACL